MALNTPDHPQFRRTLDTPYKEPHELRALCVAHQERAANVLGRRARVMPKRDGYQFTLQG